MFPNADDKSLVWAYLLVGTRSLAAEILLMDDSLIRSRE